MGVVLELVGPEMMVTDQIKSARCWHDRNGSLVHIPCWFVVDPWHVCLEMNWFLTTSIVSPWALFLVDTMQLLDIVCLFVSMWLVQLMSFESVVLFCLFFCFVCLFLFAVQLLILCAFSTFCVVIVQISCLFFLQICFSCRLGKEYTNFCIIWRGQKFVIQRPVCAFLLSGQYLIILKNRN